MHKYLNAIGYGGLTSEKELNQLLREAENVYSHHELMTLDPDVDYCEYRTECANNIGLCICGTTDMEEHFERHYYYPYFKGSGVTSYADVMIERRIDKEAYAGICEDAKLGISLIFHLQNTAECMQLTGGEPQEIKQASITLSGLCNYGMILLPVIKSPEQERKRKEESKNRMKLLSAARNGDQSAMETLTLDDLDTYTKVSRRLITEDVFSIVDTYFMPYGIECDSYSILGEILAIQKTENWQTGEELYIMQLNVNEIRFDVCVPKSNLVGEPAVGRRFKGNIWLQGRINIG